MVNKRKYGRCLQAIMVTVSFVLVFIALGHIQHNSYAFQGTTACSHQDGKRQEPTFLVGMNQDDPALVAHIRRQMATPSVLSYNLTHPETEHFSQGGKKKLSMTDLLNQTDGFFVEAGAADGELFSNTLFLERRLGWRGLLVEAFPGTYRELLQKHRKAYTIQAALSLTNVSAVVNFKTSGRKGLLGHIANGNSSGIKVEAYPLYSILQALNVTKIDFLSLDVEGSELKVLQTVPWDKIKVRLMVVEYLHVPGGIKPVKVFMMSKGYLFLGNNGLDAWFGWPALLDKSTKKQKNVKKNKM